MNFSSFRCLYFRLGGILALAERRHASKSNAIFASSMPSPCVCRCPDWRRRTAAAASRSARGQPRVLSTRQALGPAHTRPRSANVVPCPVRGDGQKAASPTSATLPLDHVSSRTCAMPSAYRSSARSSSLTMVPIGPPISSRWACRARRWAAVSWAAVQHHEWRNTVRPEARCCHG